MANTIRIPRSVSTNTPTSLAQGELANSEAGSPNGINELFIGIAASGIHKLITNTGGAAAEPNSSAQDNQTITTGLGIDGAEAGDSGNITISFDPNELTVTALAAGDWLVFEDVTDGAPKKALLSAINLSLFNDDLGHVENAVHTGDVTGGTVLTIDALKVATGMIQDDAVTYAKMQNVVAADVFLGNTGIAGSIVDELTGTEATAMLDLFATAATTQGLAPGSNSLGATYYLDGSGAWSVPPGGAASNSFATITADDTDVEYTWAELGSVVADSSSDTLTVVSGIGIDIDTDAALDALRFAANFSTLPVATAVTGDWIAFDDAGVSSKALISAINLSLFNDDLGHVENATHTGQVTGATALALDVTAITAQPASGAIVAADTIITNDGGVLSEATFTQMITFFDANLSFGSGDGTVTAVTGGVGVTSSGGTAPSISLDFSELTDMTASIAGTTEFILQNGAVESRKAASEIALSFFTNDSGWEANDAATVLTTDVGSATWNWILDEDAMGTDSDTHVPTQQSVKAYVDNAVSGGLTHKGGYNATTNVPALDTGSPVLAVGDMYTVTVAGTFFTVALEIGDVLISDVDSVDAAAITDWTIVQSNIGAASESVAGYIELATQTEMDTATDDLRAVTPLKYANSTIDGGTF